MSGFSITFLTRPGCHLCESAEPLVRQAADRFGTLVEVCNIDADPVLQAEYSTRIPVILGPKGRVLAEGYIDEPGLMKALAAESRKGPGS